MSGVFDSSQGMGAIRIILNEALHYHRFEGRRMPPGTRCLVVHNICEQIRKRVGLNSDLLPEETDDVPVMDIPEIHEILTRLCRYLERERPLMTAVK